MKKIIIITKCIECPYCYVKENNTLLCSLTEIEFVFSELSDNSIHNSCTLEDLKS
jgi:hypothetical protein